MCCSITETPSHGQLAQGAVIAQMEQQSLGLLSTAYMTYQVPWKGYHSIFPVTTCCIWGKIVCHAHQFGLLNE